MEKRGRTSTRKAHRPFGWYHGSPAELMWSGGYGETRQLFPGPEIWKRDPPITVSLGIQRNNPTLGFRNGCRSR